MPIYWFMGLFDSDRWMPRWACGRWQEWEGWLYIYSDVAIALAYFAIPTLIAAFVLRRKTELPFLKIFWLFFFFIFLCGATHLVDAIIFYKPIYQFSAFLRFATAIVSWGTVVALMYYLPQAIKLKTAVQFEHEIQQRQQVEKQLENQYIDLEAAQRIAKVGSFKYLFSEPEIKASIVFYEILGIDPTSAHTSAQLQNNIHPDDVPLSTGAVQAVKVGGGSYDIQYRYLKSDNEVVYIHSRGQAIYDENRKIIGIQGFLQDITQLKTTEYNLQRRALELESINKELELFAYAASHDLQEPLRKLRAFGDRLNQKYSEQLDDTGRDYLSRMDNAAIRMQNLIDDLLAYSRLARSKDEKQEVDLNTMLAELLADLDDTVADKGIKVNVGPMPTFQGSSHIQMRQLFLNLLTNAFKFTKENSSPTVDVTHRLAKGRELPWKTELEDLAKYHVIEIKDNGIGFDQQFAEKIFIMFQRLHGRGEYPGTGIGLALCKKIVENHGGIIKAHGVEGEGAVFTVVLPVKKS